MSARDLTGNATAASRPSHSLNLNVQGTEVPRKFVMSPFKSFESRLHFLLTPQ